MAQCKKWMILAEGHISFRKKIATICPIFTDSVERGELKVYGDEGMLCIWNFGGPETFSGFWLI